MTGDKSAGQPSIGRSPVRELSIGELGRLAGCKVQTIRYYEEIGLLPPPARTSGNQRRYDRACADRLAFIRHARELGFPLDAIRRMLDLGDDPDRPCEEIDAIARDQLRAVERRLRSLAALKTELERMIDACGGGRVADCRIIDVLRDHSLCVADAHAPGAPPPGSD